jgi:small subunit ribosomal protein S6
VRTYEVIFIATPTVTAEDLDAYVAQLQNVIEEKNGQVVKIDNWGKRTLAYKIKRFRDGIYVVMTIEADGSIIAEIERRCRVTDYILRYLSVRIDENLKRAEKIKAARQRKSPPKPVPEITPSGPEATPA